MDRAREPPSTTLSRDIPGLSRGFGLGARIGMCDPPPDCQSSTLREPNKVVLEAKHRMT